MAAESASPLAQRRLLRAELRAARRAAGLTQEQVAAGLDWPVSKVVRIESGSADVSTKDLRALLRQCQIVDPDRIGRLSALAQAARAGSWWSGYREVAPPGLLQLVSYENAASIARTFEPLIVPGLLQTEEYARVIIGRFMHGSSAQRVDRLVEFRMRRQELVDKADAPLLLFVIDEAVVHRLVGGEPVMRRQLGALIDAADRPNVTIEVIPFTVGIHSGLRGPFVALEFPEPADDDVLYLENHRGDLISRDIPEEIQEYREEFESLRRISLGPEGSLSYLRQMTTQ